MTPIEFRVFCTALGFTAVVIQGGKLPKGEGAIRAKTFAGLIEGFCRETVPEAFDKAGADPKTSEFAATAELRDRMVAAVVEIIKATGECVPDDLLAKGFTEEEITRHWAMAHALAKVELDMKDAE